MKKHSNLSNFVWVACLCLLPAGSINAQQGMVTQGGKMQAPGTISKADQKWQKGGVFEGYAPNQEILEKRSLTTKHFSNPNGTSTAQVMTAGIHYRDANGAWQDRDMAIVANHSANNPFGFVNLSNEVKSYFPSVAGTAAMRLTNENGKQFEWWQRPSVTYIDINGLVKKYEAQAVNATLVPGSNRLHYTSIYPGITEEFTTIDGGVENNTIIHALNADISALSGKGLVSFNQFIPLEQGWQLLDHLGREIRKNAEVTAFSIRIPGMDQLVNFGRIVAFDHHLDKEAALAILALPEEKRSAADQELLANNIFVGKFNLKFVTGGIEISSRVPAKWLQATGRAFPVTIDPTITIGTTTGGSTTYSTLVQLWGYHRNAELYLQSEIGVYGAITAIEYYKSGTQASRTKPTKVWMRTTSGTTLPAAPGEPWNSTTFTGGLSTLFDGNTTQDNTMGWKMITLTTPFNYTADNLLIMVKNDYGGSGSAQSIAGNQSISNRSAYLTADGADPSDASNAKTNGTLVKLSDIRITYTTSAPVCAAPTAPSAGSVTATTAVLDWTQSGTPAQWQIKYGPTGFNVSTGGTAILTSTKPYTLNPPLSSSTTYDYYVRAICGPNDTSAWSPVTTFTTLCTTPAILSHPDSSRCGAGTVELNATASAGATIQWYAAATGGTALATGNTYTTPALSATTSYYITAKTGTCESSPRQEIKAIIKQAASVDTIAADLTAAPTVAFQAVNPQNVTTYAWSFGSGGSTSALQNPTFVYPTSSSAQNYTVSLIVSNDCGNDTVTTVINIPGTTGVNDLKLNNDDLKIYPNPTAQYFRLENNSPYQLKQLRIINVLGQIVRTIPVNSNTASKIDVSNMASGLYNIRIEFEEGTVIRKLEILK